MTLHRSSVGSGWSLSSIGWGWCAGGAWHFLLANDCGQVRRGKGVRYATDAESRRHLDHTCSVLGSSNRLLKCPAPAVRPPVHYPLSALPANTRLTAAHDA